jgi:hypothetical protein
MPGVKVGRARNFASISGKITELSLSEAPSIILELNTASYSEGTRDSVFDVEQPGPEAYR